MIHNTPELHQGLAQTYHYVSLEQGVGALLVRWLMSMVEPLAAAIISSPSGSRLLKLALHSMSRPSRRSFPSDSFSPLPWNSTCKETAVEPPTLECNQCWLPPSDPMRNSPCISRHSPWCPIRNRLFMMHEVIPRRPHLFPHPFQRPTRHYTSSAARVLSSQTRSLDWPQPARPHEHEEPASEFRSLLTARTPFDPDHAWHLFMASSQADPNNRPLTTGDQVQFIRHLLDVFELYGDAPPDLPLLYTWGTRLEPVLRDLESNLDETFPDITSLRCFTAQVHAWLGDITQALQLARDIRASQLNHAEKCTLLGVYRNILVLSRYRLGVSYALDLLIREWMFLGTFYHAQTVHFPQAVSFRTVVHTLLADVPDGASLLISCSQMNQDDRSRLGELLLEMYCIKQALHKAHALVLEMDRQRLTVKFHLRAKLTRLLARRDLFVLAHEIFTSMDPSTNSRLYHSTGLHLCSRRGDVDRAEQFFSKHIDNDWSIPVARCMLMHAYAVAGKVEKVVELFHRFFPMTPEGEFLAERPGTIHYTAIILAHSRLANFEGIDSWLEKMLQAGCRPDGHVYSIILETFARHGDIDSVVAMFDQMRTAEVKPDRVHYTSVVSLLARRKDAVAAEAFYLRALREGITPDRVMITSLMNAHVEAGSWEGVVRIFDYLGQSSRFPRDLSIEVYNTLLKAYVLIGTPFRVVLGMFRKLVRVGVRPDSYTYALVIQSACDAGKMDLAEELFAEMEEKANSGGPLYHLNAYVLTILMAGHVRQRSKARAKACYDDMRRRGIKPSSVTYTQVLQAYANDRTEASLKTTESFLKQIMDADPQGWNGSESRPSALGNIYSPLMLAYARKEKPEEVVRLFNGMLEAGGEPSLESLTIVLDAHRRTNNIEVVRRLWPQIWDLALRLSRANELFKGDSSTTVPVLRQRSSLLCMPLSIYIDALSAAGEHQAVLDVWTRAKAEGFSFDAHNWNHLAVVLVRAGELDRAFEVLERVLIPYSRNRPAIRNPSPETPLVFDVMALDADNLASDAPMHRKARRAKAVKLTTKMEMVGSILAMSEESSDFAHPLHILHQVIPALSTWRPHAVTLQVLSKVVRHLQKGRLVQPIHAADAPQATRLTDADLQSQAEIANRTLERIYHNYPEAVRAVLLYEREQARREAVRRSPKQWIKVK